VTRHIKDEESALSKEIHFGALLLVTIGLGVLLFVGANIFLQQRFSTTESDDIVCIEPAVLVVDASANFLCEVPIVISTPEASISPSPQDTNTPSVIPSETASTSPSSIPTASNKPSQTPTTASPIEPSVVLNPDADLKYAQYSKSPKTGSKIGTLKLKELNKSMPLVEGSGKSSLKLGAGHYIGSVFPGVKDNSVVAGHRETVFRSLGKLEIGHRVIATTSEGTFTYQVTETRIVDDSDRTVIVPTDEATLTLITCYPFEAYGPKPKRYIVSAQLISSTLKNN
jgi:sortase A